VGVGVGVGLGVLPPTSGLAARVMEGSTPGLLDGAGFFLQDFGGDGRGVPVGKDAVLDGKGESDVEDPSSRLATGGPGKV